MMPCSTRQLWLLPSAGEDSPELSISLERVLGVMDPTRGR